MSRITSILKTNCLDTSITNLPTFNLTELNLKLRASNSIASEFKVRAFSRKNS